MNTFSDDFPYHRSLVGYAGAFYHLVGIQDFLLRMLSFLPLNVAVVKLLLVFILNPRHI